MVEFPAITLLSTTVLLSDLFRESFKSSGSSGYHHHIELSYREASTTARADQPLGPADRSVPPELPDDPADLPSPLVIASSLHDGV